jgi:hypothetical protein
MALISQRTISVLGMTLNVVTFVDRRPTAAGVQEEFLFQTELETLLFDSEVIGTTGAFYRLLLRSGVGALTLPLRRSSVREGLLSDEEFDALRELLHSGVRVFTLVPVTAIGPTVATFGRTPQSEALLAALGLSRPDAWSSGAEGKFGDGDGEDGGDDGGGDGAADSRHGPSGSSSGHVDGSESRSRSEDGEDDCPSTEEEAEPQVVGEECTTRRLPPVTVSPALEAQLQAFIRFRTQTVNRQRKGRVVVAITAADDRRRVLGFFAWLQHAKGVHAPSMGAFGSSRMGGAVEEYIEERKMLRKESTIAKTIASLVAASRFTHAVRKANAAPGTVVSTTPLDELVALHAQVLSEARQATKFSAALPPKAWLTWEECQRARLRAEKAVATYDGTDAAGRLTLVRASCLLRLLTALPPDRVGVYRSLRLGGTLKATDDGYQVDLSERGAHKTSAVFGPSRTTVTAGVASRITALVSIDGLKAGEYLFHSDDRQSPLEPFAWTRFVQRTFKTYSGVSLSPKDCRSSFVTWMRDGEHGDETLRAAAQAMRHSSATAASASYDKHGTDRVVSAAVAAADAFARRYAFE